jgi:hypothetical protein
MTDLLEQAIAKVKQLPDSEQDNIAQIILKELETKKWLIFGMNLMKS